MAVYITRKKRLAILDSLVGTVVEFRNSWPTTKKGIIQVRGVLDKRDLTKDDWLHGFDGFWSHQPVDDYAMPKVYVIDAGSSKVIFQDCRVIFVPDSDCDVHRIYL